MEKVEDELTPLMERRKPFTQDLEEFEETHIPFDTPLSSGVYSDPKRPSVRPVV